MPPFRVPDSSYFNESAPITSIVQQNSYQSNAAGMAQKTLLLVHYALFTTRVRKDFVIPKMKYTEKIKIT